MVMGEHGEVVKWYWQDKAEALVNESVTVPLLPAQIPCALTHNRTPSSALSSQRLASWDSAGPWGAQGPEYPNCIPGTEREFWTLNGVPCRLGSTLCLSKGNREISLEVKQAERETRHWPFCTIKAKEARSCRSNTTDVFMDQCQIQHRDASVLVSTC